MGGYIGYKETGKGQVNAGAFEARQNRFAELVGHRDAINIKARELGSPVGAINKVETFTQRQAQAKEQAYQVKLNRADREKALAVIKVKQSILGNGETRQMAINRAEEIKVAQQTRHEINEIAQNIPPEMALGPLMVLIARIIRKLPDKAYKYLSATVILSMALSACSAINHKDIGVNQAESAAETALLPDSASDNHAEVEVAPTAAATETVQAVDSVEDLYNRYLAGENIDVSSLSEDDFIELSAKLAEKKNADRGINPIIYDNGTGNPAFINPDNYMLMNYDGHPDMDETIQMFVPIAGKDEQGNLQFEVDGQIVTIPGSADEDWNMVISDPDDTRIDWPETKLIGSTGLPDAKNKVASYGVVLTPMILLDKNLGQFYLAGEVPLMQSTLRFLKIETDQAGHPLFTRKIITHGIFYYLNEEESDLDIRSSSGPISTDSNFYKALMANTIYYIGLSPNVEKSYATMENSVDGYSGAVVNDTAFKIIFDEVQNDKDMVIMPVTTLMMKN